MQYRGGGDACSVVVRLAGTDTASGVLAKVLRSVEYCPFLHALW